MFIKTVGIYLVAMLSPIVTCCAWAAGIALAIRVFIWVIKASS